MKIKKSFLIGIFLLGVLSLGFVCAGDNSSLDNMQDDALGESAVEDSQSDVNILRASPQDSDLTQSNESGDKENLDIILYTLDHIYPWSWAYSDGDSGPGVDIWCFNEYEMTGNSTVYLDDEVIYEGQGEFPDLIHVSTLWEHYNGNGQHTVKIVYSGDDNYNPLTKSRNFNLSAYICELDGNVVFLSLPSAAPGVLTVRTNGRTILTKDIVEDYISQPYGSKKTLRFALDGLDSGVNHIAVSFTSDWTMYSFDESFEYYYNGTSNGAVPNQDNASGNSSEFHREVRAGNDSKVSLGSVVAGNPLLVLALALSSAVLLPRRK